MTTKPTAGAVPPEQREGEIGRLDLDSEPGLGSDEAFDGHDADPELALIDRVRARLEIAEEELSDVTIAASLAAIAASGDVRGRWLAAFGSPLGRHLALRGADLNAALNAVLALAPRRH